jgi:hypothetical protein
MSLQVPLEDLASHAADYGRAAYVIAGSASGPPRAIHSAVRFDGQDVIVSIGGRTATVLSANPFACVLWPATDDQSMSLIVDGEVVGDIDADGGEIRIRPTGAVHHRPAP